MGGVTPPADADADSFRGGWLVWGSALSLYLLAVFHRSSLAVAGLTLAACGGGSSSPDAAAPAASGSVILPLS